MSDPLERAKATGDRSGAPAQRGWAAGAIAVTGFALSLFQLYGAGIEPLGLFYQRSIHLGFIMALAFLMFPAFGRRKRGALGWAIDVAFLAAAVASAAYLCWNLDAIFSRAGFWTRTDIVMGIVAIVAVLEASRRVIGLPMTLIGVAAIVYGLAGSCGALRWLGEWLPVILQHRGSTVDRLIGQLYLGQEGMGLLVTASYIVLVGPALSNEFGKPLLIAHLVVF